MLHLYLDPVEVNNMCIFFIEVSSLSSFKIYLFDIIQILTIFLVIHGEIMTIYDGRYDHQKTYQKFIKSVFISK